MCTAVAAAFHSAEGHVVAAKVAGNRVVPPEVVESSDLMEEALQYLALAKLGLQHSLVKTVSCKRWESTSLGMG